MANVQYRSLRKMLIEIHAARVVSYVFSPGLLKVLNDRPAVAANDTPLTSAAESNSAKSHFAGMAIQLGVTGAEAASHKILHCPKAAWLHTTPEGSS